MSRIGYILLCVYRSDSQSDAFQRLLEVLKQQGGEPNVKIRKPKWGSIAMNDPNGPMLWFSTLGDIEKVTVKLLRSPNLTATQLQVWWDFAQELDKLRRKYEQQHGQNFLAATKGELL